MDARNILEALLAGLPTLTDGEKLVLRTVVSVNEQREARRVGDWRHAKAQWTLLALQRFAEEPYQLTPREIEVLERLLNGASNKEAGRDLGISHRTIEVHRQRIMMKIGARSPLHMASIVSQIARPG